MERGSERVPGGGLALVGRASYGLGPRSDRRGVALVTALLLVITVSAFSFTVLSSSLRSAREVDEHHDAAVQASASQSASSLAIQWIWSGYLAQQGGQPGTIASIRVYLDGLGIDAAGTEIVANLGLPAGGGSTPGISGMNVESVWAWRTDQGSNTEINIRTSISRRRGDVIGRSQAPQVYLDVFTLEPGDWSGLEYALLANNVNCILCHAEIGTSELYYNQDPGKYGTFDRVKVGTLESILIRDKAESEIAGTLYVRGQATDKSGVPITDWSSQTLKSHGFDALGKVQQDNWGAPTIADLVPADPLTPVPLENLYLDYSMVDEDMVDGYLPQAFPPPFNDDGGYDPVLGGPDPNAVGNRQVDPSEFATVNATGTLSGGSIFVADPANPIDTQGELSTSLTIGNTAGLAGATQGNVVLTGTLADPIIIDGDVAIDGDVVIQGYVRGEGTLMASGNVYVPSDLIYVDGVDASGARTFGLAPDGSTNALALAAGGSLVAGDLFYKKSKKGKSPPAPVTGDASGSFSFVLSEMALFNRAEWMKTQPLLPGSGESYDFPSSWTAANQGYQPGYLPRYYVFNEAGTIPYFVKDGYYDPVSNTWVGKEHSSKWDSTNDYAYPTDPNDSMLYNPDGSPKAVVHQLTARGGWMTDAMLRQMMSDAVAAKQQGSSVEIDGILYTNNSIFGIVGRNTPMNGQMIVNGGIVAADVGLLVPGDGTSVGLQLNYDQRGQGLLQLKSTSSVSLKHKLHAPLPSI